MTYYQTHPSLSPDTVAMMIEQEMLVPVEPDLPYVAELVKELYDHARSEHTAFNTYQWAQRFVWRVQRGIGDTE